MKKFLVAAAGLVALAAPAIGADMPVKAIPPAPLPIWNWTGFYAGIEGGYAWGDSVQSYTLPPTFTTGRYNIRGGEVGGTLGYNWQINQWVLGIEGDLSSSRINGTGASNVFYDCGTICYTTVKALGTLRGRVGYAINNVLLYGTGGLAYGEIGSNLDGFTATNWRTGWTAGAGVEYGFAPHWTAKLEWLYVDFHSFQWTNATVIPVIACAGVNCSTDARFSVVRVGVNYTFGGPVVAKY
jgi:outer membrane immunogenic protein